MEASGPPPSLRRVLVTGGGGGLAQAITARGGPNVRAARRQDLDVADEAAIERALDAWRPSLLVNTAALTDVDAAERDPDAAVRVNAKAPGLLARCCRERRIPLIHVSTDYVFGADDGIHREGDVARPINTYGVAKLAGEDAALANGFRVCVTRVAWLFGRSDDFLNRMLALGESRSVVRVVAQQGSPTPLWPLADRLLRLSALMIDGATTPPILHVAGSPPTSRIAWVRTAFAAAEAHGLKLASLEEARLEDFPTPAARPRSSALDTSLADALLGPIDWRTEAAAVGADFARGRMETS